MQQRRRARRQQLGAQSGAIHRHADDLGAGFGIGGGGAVVAGILHHRTRPVAQQQPCGQVHRLLTAADQDDLRRRHRQAARGGQPAGDGTAELHHAGHVIARRTDAQAADRVAQQRPPARHRKQRGIRTPDAPFADAAATGQGRGTVAERRRHCRTVRGHGGRPGDEGALGRDRFKLAFRDQPFIGQQHRDTGYRELLRHHAGGWHARARLQSPGCDQVAQLVEQLLLQRSVANQLQWDEHDASSVDRGCARRRFLLRLGGILLRLHADRDPAAALLPHQLTG